MRKTVLLLASGGLSVVVAISVVLFSGLTSTGPRKARAATARPNIVFILADDMRKDDLKYMPKTRSLLEGRGMSFRNAFVSDALCTPSRSTIMRGQYAHNTGVWTNTNGLDGGWQAYKSHNGDNESNNVATHLRQAGYRTGLFGKYLNGYDGSTVPRGWADWFAFSGRAGSAESAGAKYYDYDINHNGTIRHYGTSESDYSTDVIRGETQQFIGTSVRRGKPFFAYVATKTPHSPYIPAPRDLHTYDGLKAPRSPSFNESDVTDKPPWIQSLPRLSTDDIAQIDDRYENRAEMLQALDDLVAGVVGTLKDEGVLSNTYIFFTSDNGWHNGEHRIPKEKWRPYEEDIHMPLLVRGPGVQAGSTTDKLTLNTDYMPTFLDLATAQNPSYVDGRSLRRVLDGSMTTWRSAILPEAAANYSPAYEGIRTISTGSLPKRKYVEYAGGAKELYNLDTDPYELTNIYDPNSPPSDLVSRLQALKTCGADAKAPVTCQVAEGQ